MGNNTPNLNLYKANPKEDGESTFNIDTILNDNWDKIDEFKQEYRELEDEVLNPKMAKTEKQVASIINLPNAVDGQASVGVGGRTVTNILEDYVAGCESISVWSLVRMGASLDNNNQYEGDYCIKMVIDTGYTDAGMYYNILPLLYSSKHYLITAHLKNGSLSGNGVRFNVNCVSDTGQIWSSYVTETSYERQGVVIRPSDFDTATHVYITPYIYGVDGEYAFIDAIMVNEITEYEYNNLTVDELMQKYPHISGTKSVSNTRIKSVGKNLCPFIYDFTETYGGKFDVINNIGFQHDFVSRNYVMGVKKQIKSGTYTISCNHNLQNGKQIAFTFRKEGVLDTIDQISTYFNVGDTNKTVTVGEGYNFFCIGRVGAPTAPSNVIVSNIQLEEGSTATTYEPYKELISYITLSEGVDELHSLPNGVKDEVTPDGELIKRIKEHVLQESDIIALITSTKNIDYINMKKPIDWSENNKENVDLNKCIYSRIILGYGYADNIAYQYCAFNSKPTEWGIVIPKGIYTTLEQAKQALAGTKLIYQLAQPQIYDLTVTPVTCFKDGTIYIESADNNAEYVLPETQFSYPINTAGALNSNTMAINQLSNQYQLIKAQQCNVSDEQKLQMLGQQITQLKLGGM